MYSRKVLSKVVSLLVLTVCFLALFDSSVFCKARTSPAAPGKALVKSGAKAALARGPKLTVPKKKPIQPLQKTIPAKPALQAAPQVGTSFIEAEVRIDKQFTLDYLKGLPTAPASVPKVLNKPARVVLQLPAEQVTALVNKGADVSIIRKFILAGFSKPNPTNTKAIGSCEYDNENQDVYIPDYDGWVYSGIQISCAPAGATVTSIDVYYQIEHSFVGDLLVDLDSSDLSCEYHLFDDPSNSGDYLSEIVTGITVCNGEPANQWWYLYVQDTYPQDTGYIDYWRIKVYYEEGGGTAPANDECGSAIAVSEGVPYSGSTNLATGTDVTSCGDNDWADVWNSFTPTATGDYTISLCGSAFDTTVAVFYGCWIDELACNDDFCGLQSEVEVALTAGHKYLIRVSGYDGDTGDYELTVTTAICLPPEEPYNPSPSSGAANVPLDTVLSWNNPSPGSAIKVTNSNPADKVIMPKLIYGSDDRKDEYEVTNPDILAAGDSTVAILCSWQLFDNGNGTFSLPTETFAQYYLAENGVSLCTNEPFRNQPNPAFCSGFLVAPDIIATAGHCPGSQGCPGVENQAFVFGFVMLDATTPVLTIDESEIYYGVELLDSVYTSTTDWALIRLDRPVTGHTPLPFRSSGCVANGQPLITIGHPMGLPKKYAGNATVRENDCALPYFSANTDTYTGNSGSPVFNATNLQVEGILVRGNPDFVYYPPGNCDRSNVCPDTGCPGWEAITRTTEFADALPRYDVYFDVVCPPTALLYSDITTTSCQPRDPTTVNGSLRPGVTYYWQVVAKNSCGQTAGNPCWSFTTAVRPHVISREIAATHGSAGEIWNAVDDGYIEPRTYGIKKLRFCFDTAMDTNVTNISTMISIYGANGGTQPVLGSVVWESSTCMVITLSSALPDENAYIITLTNAIKSALGTPLEGIGMCLTALKGDANGDRIVTGGDLLAILSHNSQPVNSSTARYDINCDGYITSGDRLAANSFRPPPNTAPDCPGTR